jgi:hypothetical protein
VQQFFFVQSSSSHQSNTSFFADFENIGKKPPLCVRKKSHHHTPLYNRFSKRGIWSFHVIIDWAKQSPSSYLGVGMRQSRSSIAQAVSLKPEVEFEVIKLVLLRERYLQRLEKKLQESKGKVDLGIIGSIDVLRDATVETVETIVTWERTQVCIIFANTDFILSLFRRFLFRL